MSRRPSSLACALSTPPPAGRQHRRRWLTPPASASTDARPPPRARAQIKDLGCKAGVVLNPGTPISAIEYVLDQVDLILVMSVNPGFGGQKFIESQVDKIRKLRALCNERGLNPWIEVDGGVTPANAYKVIDAGANALVAGSAVFGAKSYAEGARTAHRARALRSTARSARAAATLTMLRPCPARSDRWH